MDKAAMVSYNDSMSESLSLFFDTEVQRLIDSFAYCFRVRITLFTTDMKEVLVGLENPGAPFCLAVQRDLKLRHRCLAQDQQMCNQAREQGRLLSYRCHAGLQEAILPLYSQGELLGYAMLGQFRMGDQPDPGISQGWRLAGYLQEPLNELFKQQPLYDQLSMENMLHLFEMMISFIISRDYVRIKRPGLVDQISAYIDANIEKTISIKDVAIHFHKSTSTISHILKAQIGMSFKQLSIIKKIQHFEAMLRFNPTLQIKTAAHQVGYDDPLYFSRLYKKYRFIAPSAFIELLKNENRGSFKTQEVLKEQP